MSPAERDEAAKTANTVASRLFDAHALMLAARRQVQAIEDDGVHDVQAEADSLGRVLRQAECAVYELAGMLADCLVTTHHDATRAKLRELSRDEGRAS